MKKRYIKPSIEVYRLQNAVQLLQASRLSGNNPFKWGVPDSDR